jgi:DNA-binding protein YbaB
MFGQAKDLYKLQKQAKQVKKKLKSLHVEAEVNGIKVVISAEQEIIDIQIPDELLSPEKKTELQKNLKEAVAKAMKKSQEVAASEMREIMDSMGMGGLSSMLDQGK